VTAPPRIDTAPWEKVQEWDETAFSSPIVTVEAANAVYEQPEFLETFRPLFAAGIEQTPRAIFTTGLSFSRAPPGEKTTEKVLGIAAKYASREFKKSLAEDGLVNVRRTGSKDLRLRGRRTAKAFQYDAGYPFSGAAVGSPGTHPELQVRVWAALWPTAESFEMAGGIYPLEDLADAVARVDGETDVTVTARPGADRRTVLDCIRDAAE
jgi:hypothetical protein